MSDALKPSQSIHTRSSIWRMYRDAADHDYLIARFSARSNLLYQFWWNAQQAVEKYLKACLLLNEFEVASANHRLSEMYATAVELAGDLLPTIHCPPRYVVRKSWPDVNPRGFYPVCDFVKLIEQNGDPNNRYRAFSIDTRAEYLVYFDELCFCLRRIAFPLDMKLTECNLSARDALTKHRSRQLHPEMGFESVLEKTHKSVWEQSFKWCNFAYFPEECLVSGEYPRWGGTINSEIFLAYQSKKADQKNSIFWIADRGFPRGLRNEVKTTLAQK